MSAVDADREQIQHNIQSRLKKIEGQIRGVQGMVSSGKDCEQILIQVRAAQSALKSVSTLILKHYLHKCHENMGDDPSKDDVLRQLEKTVSVLTKFIDS